MIGYWRIDCGWGWLVVIASFGGPGFGFGGPGGGFCGGSSGLPLLLFVIGPLLAHPNPC